jgi:hypothetical protein
VVGAVGVAVDDAFDAFFLGVMPEAPVHVESHGAGVEFDPGAVFGAGINDGGLVDFVGFALEKQASGEVAHDLDVGILHNADEALGHFGFALGETLVDAGDDDIEFGEEVIVEIESAIGENVHFGAGEETKFLAGLGEFEIEGGDFN